VQLCDLIFFFAHVFLEFPCFGFWDLHGLGHHLQLGIRALLCQFLQNFYVPYLLALCFIFCLDCAQWLTWKAWRHVLFGRFMLKLINNEDKE
jgi:hypothetical protein